MLFKDLAVGDVFKLINRDTKFIKLSAVNDNEYPFKKYYNYPSNMFIIDKQHYGVLSPMAEVHRIKEFHESNWVTVNVLCQKLKEDSTSYVRNPVASFEMCLEYFPSVEKVVFNYPATIVLWGDGTRTVVKCQEDDKFDPEKGLALCFMKKALGNKSNFNNVFKKWIKPETTAVCSIIQDITTKHAASSTKDAKGGRKLVQFTDCQIADIVEAMPSKKLLARKSRLSVATVKKALRGEPVTLLTLNKIQVALGWEITK